MTVLQDAGVIARVSYSGRTQSAAGDPPTTLRVAKARLTDLWVGPDYADHAQALRARYGVPVTVLAHLPQPGEALLPERKTLTITEPVTEPVTDTVTLNAAITLKANYVIRMISHVLDGSARRTAASQAWDYAAGDMQRRGIPSDLDPNDHSTACVADKITLLVKEIAREADADEPDYFLGGVVTVTPTLADGTLDLLTTTARMMDGQSPGLALAHVLSERTGKRHSKKPLTKDVVREYVSLAIAALEEAVAAAVDIDGQPWAHAITDEIRPGWAGTAWPLENWLSYRSYGPDDPEPNYAVVDWFEPPHPLALPNDVCDRLVEAAKATTPSARRNGSDHLPDLDPDFEAAIIARFEQANALWWNLDIDRWTIRVKHYTSGEHHPEHQDIHAHGGATRKFAGVVQLSNPDDYEGGALCMYFAHHQLTAGDARGTLIAFPGWTLHEVQEITSGERWALCVNGWGPRLR